MKKVLFASMVLLSTSLLWGGNVYAQDATGSGTEGTTSSSATKTSVKFTADGETLTISGQGDLTSYMTTDFSARVFTDKAVGFIFADADGKTAVAANASYNANQTYYQATYEYTQIVKDGMPKNWLNGFGEVKTGFNKEKIENLYSGYCDNNNSIVIQSKVKDTDNPIIDGDNATWTYDNVTYSPYFVCTSDLADKTIALTELENKGVTLVKKGDLNNYLTTTYQVSGQKSLFVTHSGSTEKTALVANTTYTYQSGDTFYEGTATYSKIEDNDKFFGENGTHSDYIQADNTQISFKNLLARKILAGVEVKTYSGDETVGTDIYKTVKFVNEGSESLLIDADVVRAILHPTYNNAISTNVTTTKLDLGEATLSELNADVFMPSENDSYRNRNLKLDEITFPKTKLTSVYSESDKKCDDKMVLPDSLLTYISSTIKTINIPEGYDRIADEAFIATGDFNLEKVNLPKGLTLIGKKAFYNCSKITSVQLNDGLENIGKEAFSGTSLTSIKFPSSLKIIDDAAFANCKITGLKFNAGLQYIGNSAFALSAEQTEETIEIPASVVYIGPHAFNFRQYQDVYFYGATAPVMPLGKSCINASSTLETAFSAHTLMGNNGFNPSKTGLADNANEGYANRENYKNNGTYFCILHYPKDLKDEQRACYTDITRTYKTIAEDAKSEFSFAIVDDNAETYYEPGKETTDLTWKETTTSGQADKKVALGYQDTYLGRSYIWPSQQQWNRAYIVNSNGYNWDGVTKYRSKLTDDQLQALEYAGYKKADATDQEKGEYSLDELQKIAHMGTRQFVLTNADVNVDEKPDEEPEYKIDVKQGQWWTLCVPFNMTKKQVLDTFGSETKLYYFYQVDRYTVNGKNSILLKFTKDALNNSSTDAEGKKLKGDDGKWEYDKMDANTADDEVVIWAHESYMIKPMNGENSDKDAVFVVKNYSFETGNPLPTVVTAKGQDQLQDDDYSKEYRFIGNYLGSTDESKIAIPKYSYVYGKTKSDATYKFRFYTGTTSVWKPNKSLVQSHDRQGGLLDYKNFFGSDDTSDTPLSAKQASIFGEENFGETTGIADVTIIAGDEILTPIFTIDGKMVSANGSVDGLAKGIYVKSGKKFVVK